MTRWRHWVVKDVDKKGAQYYTYKAWVARGKRQDEYPGICRWRGPEYAGFIDAERF